MHTLVREAVPSSSHGALAEPLEIRRAIVARSVMLSGNEEFLSGPRALDELLRRVELHRLRRVGDIARVQQKIWCIREPVDLVQRQLESPGHILVGRLVETNMAVADLHE